MYTQVYTSIFFMVHDFPLSPRPRKGKAEMVLGRAMDAAQSFHQGLQLAPEHQARHGVTRGDG